MKTNKKNIRIEDRSWLNILFLIIPYFIEQLPIGFHTYLGEHGAALSGGEKQRIAIARALYQQPEILILDEATSSLDSQSEQYIKKTVLALKKKKKTILLIAHRLSTVIDADQILVLKKGKVVASGTNKLY